MQKSHGANALLWVCYDANAPLWVCHDANVPLWVCVTPQIRNVTGQRQPYTYASKALTY